MTYEHAMYHKLMLEAGLRDKYDRALEKNTRAIAFYQKHGFHRIGHRTLEEGTTEYLVRMEREKEGRNRGENA